MKHKHHIIPRHMGGTDDPSNIVEVSVEEHAELHLSLYLAHGKYEDWVAYHALSGQMEVEDLLLERARLGARHPNVRSEETNKKRSLSMQGRRQSSSHLAAKIKAADKQRVLNDLQRDEVIALRELGWTLQEIAYEYNTTDVTIWRYIHGKVKGAN